MDENNRGLEIVRYNNNQGGGVRATGGRLEKKYRHTRITANGQMMTESKVYIIKSQ